MKAIIVDDERNAGEALHKMLQLIGSDVEVIEIFNDPRVALEQLKTLTYDLLFLDIQMPFLTGFELLDKLESIPFQIIFTTAYDQYAMQAFKVSAADYLLKPIDMDDLEKAVDKAKSNILNKSKQESNIINVLNTVAPSKMQKLALATFEGIYFAAYQDIIRLESDSNYTKFYFANKETLLVSKTIGEYEKILDPQIFCRVHHSHIINLGQLSKFIKVDGGYAEMSDGSKVEISRRKKDEFMKKVSESFH